MSDKTALLPVLVLARAWAAMAQEHAAADRRAPSLPLKVLLDCEARFEDPFRTGIDFVEYVDCLQEADVCVRVTNVASRRRHDECRVEFIGMGRFEGIEAMARVGVVRRRAPCRASCLRATVDPAMSENWVEQSNPPTRHVTPRLD